VTNNTLRITTKRPLPPDEADFAIFIEFKKGEGDPLRVFRAADQTIKALQILDRAFCESIDNNIKPVMVLEDIEAGSLKIWLRNILTATDDQAIKSLNWKPAVGKYLVRAKYAFVEWANKSDGRASLPELVSGLRRIAEETDVKHLPDYAPTNTQDIIAATKELTAAKGALIEGDSMKYLSSITEPADFDLAVVIDPISLEEMAIKETTKFENMQMNLVVKKPDYLGDSKWELRHGKKSISARINDSDWLRRFQARQVDVRPGDALKCAVTVEYGYGFDNELVRENYTVEQVVKVLENQISDQGRLLP